MDENDHLSLEMQGGSGFVKEQRWRRTLCGAVLLELPEHLKKAFFRYEKSFPKKSLRTSGLITPKSRCCGARLHLSKGGIRKEICNKCGKPNPPPVRYC
ncbi:MAG: hypothetical protein U1D31_03095 [Patescibacteria group bacterium]|nr:hypothetical protein [bacterium]MDZ4241080.1 hypothetical protein [Patescibacteria group bacterium]